MFSQSGPSQLYVFIGFIAPILSDVNVPIKDTILVWKGEPIAEKQRRVGRDGHPTFSRPTGRTIVWPCSVRSPIQRMEQDGSWWTTKGSPNQVSTKGNSHTQSDLYSGGGGGGGVPGASCVLSSLDQQPSLVDWPPLKLLTCVLAKPESILLPLHLSYGSASSLF